MQSQFVSTCSNNTNKLSPQERNLAPNNPLFSSNNTNKLSPQELIALFILVPSGSNNTNKLSPQERLPLLTHTDVVQIIQINLVLKNCTVA